MFLRKSLLLLLFSYFVIDAAPFKAIRNEETLKQCTLEFVTVFEKKQETIREKELEISKLRKDLEQSNLNLQKANDTNQKELDLQQKEKLEKTNIHNFETKENKRTFQRNNIYDLNLIYRKHSAYQDRLLKRTREKNQ